MIKIISLLNTDTVEHNHEPMAKDTISTNEHENPRQPLIDFRMRKEIQNKNKPNYYKTI